MNGVFYIGATGLQAQQRALGVTANNIANMNTPGFKRSTVRFSELLGAPSSAALLGGADPLQLLGATAGGVDRVFSQGELQRTDQALDLAIDGEGFVELLGPAGRSLLWRGGALQINADGYLAGPSGAPLRAMIQVPPDTSALVIQADGRVLAEVGGEAVEIGRLDLVRVTDPSQLSPGADGVYQAPEELMRTTPPGEEGVGLFVQGAVERSNVELSEEMVTLMLLQRAFAASAQVVQAGDQLMAITNGLRR